MTTAERKSLRIDKYQVCDPLSPDDYSALKYSVLEHGVEVPIVVDEHGDVIDGHHRKALAYELSVPCPEVVRPGLSEEEKEELAWRLNRARRQMTLKQKRAVWRRVLEDGGSVATAAESTSSDASSVEKWVRGEKSEHSDNSPVLPSEKKRQSVEDAIAAAPEASDRAIAKKAGVDHKTVAKARKFTGQDGNQCPAKPGQDIAATGRRPRNHNYNGNSKQQLRSLESCTVHLGGVADGLDYLFGDGRMEKTFTPESAAEFAKQMRKSLTILGRVTRIIEKYGQSASTAEQVSL